MDKIIRIKKWEEIWDQVVSWDIQMIRSCRCSWQRDGEENGHAGAKFSGDEQQGDQLGLGSRGARVGMSWISKKEVSGTKDKTE